MIARIPLQICFPVLPVFATCAVLAGSAHAQSFQGVGDLAGGPTSSAAYAVSADGNVVVGQSQSASGGRAFRWQQGSMTVLVDLAGGSFDSWALGTNADGSVIVGTAHDGSVHRPVRWDSSGGVAIPQPAGFSGGSVANGISQDGSVISGYATNNQIFSYTNITGYRFENGVSTSLPDLPGGSFDSGCLGAASDDGAIIAGRVRSAYAPPIDLYQASYWNGTSLVLLPALTGGVGFSEAYGVSADGSTCFGVSDSANSTPGFQVGEAVQWRNGNALALGDLPGGNFTSVAFSCNADGSVIVGSGTTALGTEAFIWDATHGMRRLQDVLLSDYGISTTGWLLVRANAITPDGHTIVGEGVNPGGFPEGWVVHLTSTSITSLCYPSSGGVIACPCANPGLAGRGCDNSSATGGARLDASGTPSLAADTLQFTTSGEKPSATSIVLQGSVLLPNGVVFGQGVRCAGGSLKRLYSKTASAGSIHAPAAGDPSVSARAAALGDSISAGASRWYAVYYRDPVVLGGCPAASTFNLTQTLAVVWGS